MNKPLKGVHRTARRSEILAEAKRHGAINPEDFLALIPPLDTTPASEAISALKVERPEYFLAGAAGLSSKDYAAAKREALKAADDERRGADLALHTKKVGEKNALEMTDKEWRKARAAINARTVV